MITDRTGHPSPIHRLPAKAARQRLCAALAGLVGVLASVGPVRAAEPEPASFVFIGGAVYTGDATQRHPSALAVRGEKIVFVGDDASARHWVGAGTRVVDLHGRMLLPGLQDSHLHPSLAPNPGAEVDLGGLTTRTQILDRIREFAASHGDSAWIIGSGWHSGAFLPEGFPTRELLDPIVPDRPVFLVEDSAHNAWANSAALRIAQISTATADPPGGRIGRDAALRPNGMLYEKGALNLVRARIPPLSAAERERNLAESLRKMTDHGITAAEDAAVTAEVAATYHALDVQGRLAIRMRLCQLFDPLGDDERQLKQFVATRAQLHGRRIDANCVKFLLDGSFGSHGLALLAPYEDLPGEFGKGQLLVLPARLNRLVTRLDKADFQVHLHAEGDAAARAALDAVAAARRSNGQRDNRHTIAHLVLVDPADVPRFRELGVIANMSPLWSRGDPWETVLAPRMFGAERAGRNYPMRTLLDAGASLVWGTDWPVSSLNPFEGIETAITHRFPGGVDPEGHPDTIWNPSERIHLEQALAAYTSSGAYLLHDEGVRGALVVGQQADLLVLDRNLFEVAASEIHAARPELVMIAGQVVRDSSGMR